jgi:hypothetical protein
MLIDRSTASTILKQSLVVIDVDGKIRKDVKTLDTGTMEITFGDLSTKGGGECYFVVSSEEDKTALEEELDEDIHFLVHVASSGPPKKSMDTTDTAEFFSVIARVMSSICECSNCGTAFLVHVDQRRNVWTMDKPNAVDTLFTMTKVVGPFNCDNCNATVTVLAPTV